MLPDLNVTGDALFLDIDGTLLDIAPTPDAVVVPGSLRQHLGRLHGKLGGALALVSGRALANVDKLFAPLLLPAAGGHGAEWRIAPARQGQEAYLSASLRKDIADAVSCYPALICEDKKYSLAVHYRQAPELQGKVKQLLQEKITGSAEPLKIMDGKMVFEVVNPDYNKGAAVRRFLGHPPFVSRRPIFLGDDTTDISAIEMAREMGGIGICITEDRFAPSGVRAWLERQAR